MLIFKQFQWMNLRYICWVLHELAALGSMSLSRHLFPINAFLRLFFHLNLKTTKFTNDIAYVCTFQVLYMYTGVYHSCIVKHKSRCTFEAWIDLFWHIDFKMVKHYKHLVKHIDLNMQKNELTDFNKYMLKHKLTYRTLTLTHFDLDITCISKAQINLFWCINFIMLKHESTNNVTLNKIHLNKYFFFSFEVPDKCIN